MMVFLSEIPFFIEIPYRLGDLLPGSYRLGDLLPGSKPKAALAAATAFVPSQALNRKKNMHWGNMVNSWALGRQYS